MTDFSESVLSSQVKTYDPSSLIVGFNYTPTLTSLYVSDGTKEIFSKKFVNFNEQPTSMVKNLEMSSVFSDVFKTQKERNDFVLFYCKVWACMKLLNTPIFSPVTFGLDLGIHKPEDLFYRDILEDFLKQISDIQNYSYVLGLKESVRELVTDIVVSQHFVSYFSHSQGLIDFDFKDFRKFLISQFAIKSAEYVKTMDVPALDRAIRYGGEFLTMNRYLSSLNERITSLETTSEKINSKAGELQQLYADLVQKLNKETKKIVDELYSHLKQIRDSQRAIAEAKAKKLQELLVNKHSTS